MRRAAGWVVVAVASAVVLAGCGSAGHPSVAPSTASGMADACTLIRKMQPRSVNGDQQPWKDERAEIARMMPTADFDTRQALRHYEAMVDAEIKLAATGSSQTEWNRMVKRVERAYSSFTEGC